MKKKIIKYAIAFGIAFIMALGVSFLKSLYWLDSTVEVMSALSDCFVVPGLLFILFGLLIVCSNGGTFDMLGFGLKKVILLFKIHQTEQDKEGFYEYRKRKQEHKRSFAYIIIVGVFYLIIGLIFYILYYNI